MVISERSCMGVKDLNECKRLTVLSEKVLHGCERLMVLSGKLCMGVRDLRWKSEKFCWLRENTRSFSSLRPRVE